MNNGKYGNNGMRARITQFSYHPAIKWRFIAGNTTYFFYVNGALFIATFDYRRVDVNDKTIKRDETNPRMEMVSTSPVRNHQSGDSKNS